MNLFDPISKIMTTELITVSPNDPISDVSSIFEKENIHHVPVVQQGELVGIVSSRDIIGYSRTLFAKGLKTDGYLPKVESSTVSDIMTTRLAKMEQKRTNLNHSDWSFSFCFYLDLLLTYSLKYLPYT